MTTLLVLAWLVLGWACASVLIEGWYRRVARGIAFHGSFTTCSKAHQGPVYAFQGPWQDADVERVGFARTASPQP